MPRSAWSALAPTAHPAATAFAEPTMRALNMTEHQNWQGTKVAREKPMIIRQAMKPVALVMAAIPKVAAEHRSCSTPWP